MSWMLMALKRLVRRLMPGFYKKYSRYARLTRKIIRRQGLIVSTGPFRDMRYIRETTGGCGVIAKLLGSYEAELHDAVSQIISAKPRVVVNVGCAEGYYAVGLARLLPDATVYAYDINPIARELCLKLARLNGVAGRIIIRGECTISELQALHLEEAVVVCDCEGCELELLDPVEVPWLTRATLLVELHDCFVPGLSEKLLPRFEDTHSVSLIPVKERDSGSYQSLSGLRPAQKRLAIENERGFEGKIVRQRWAYMVTRTRNEL